MLAFFCAAYFAGSGLDISNSLNNFLNNFDFNYLITTTFSEIIFSVIVIVLIQWLHL